MYFPKKRDYFFNNSKLYFVKILADEFHSFKYIEAAISKVLYLKILFKPTWLLTKKNLSYFNLKIYPEI